MNKLTDCHTLANGVQIPCVGFGTWQTPDGDVCVSSVKAAVAAGYRHIDTAAVYGNEQSVGQAIAECGVPREQLFITSKLWNSKRGYDTTIEACEKSLRDLRLSYLDLYLIHWPASAHRFDNWEELNAETWRAFEDLYAAGKLRAIGLSNFLPHHMDALEKTAKIAPMVDQIEYHPGFMQTDCVRYCREKGMLVEAWSPLGSGRVLSDPIIGRIAESYGRSPAQLCIRWVMQHDVLPLPKSVTPSRIVENAMVFDFTISAADMAELDALPDIGGSGMHPDQVNF